jgi:RimJ/RimL family protein N-acetyltransferase
MNNDFDLQPTLKGARITIRPIAADDWDAMFAGGAAFAFIDNRDGCIIGSSRYHGYDPVAREIEIDWTFLAREYRGGNYNREIKQLMLDHAFLFVDTVVFWIGEANVRSRRAIEKIGGVLRDGVRSRDAGNSPNVVYEIRKDCWPALALTS